jgi:uncharacterized membrane protein YdbT with pleckstrin-like domain
MSLAIIFLLIYLSIWKNYKPDKFVLIISCLFVLLSIKIPEYHRLRDWWAITDTSLVQSLGLFSNNIRQVDFSSISDLDLDQPLVKRILNYGNIHVRLFLNETSITIKDINNPSKFIEELQEIISKYRKHKNALGNI